MADATLELNKSANVDTAYAVVDGQKHKVQLIATPEGTLELPANPASDTGYITTTDGKKHKVKLVASLAGGGASGDFVEQLSTMPEANAKPGKIIQYVGPKTDAYGNGKFYKSVIIGYPSATAQDYTITAGTTPSSTPNWQNAFYWIDTLLTNEGYASINDGDQITVDMKYSLTFARATVSRTRGDVTDTVSQTKPTSSCGFYVPSSSSRSYTATFVIASIGDPDCEWKTLIVPTPEQQGNAGKALFTNGTDTYWDSVATTADNINPGDNTINLGSFTFYLGDISVGGSKVAIDEIPAGGVVTQGVALSAANAYSCVIATPIITAESQNVSVSVGNITKSSFTLYVRNNDTTNPATGVQICYIAVRKKQ